jgi:hypothetical protein
MEEETETKQNDQNDQNDEIKNFVVSNMADIKALMNGKELNNICKKYQIGAYEDYHDEQKDFENNVINFANEIVELTQEITYNPSFFFQSYNGTDEFKKSFFYFAKNCIEYIEHQQKMQQLNSIFTDDIQNKYELVNDEDTNTNEDTESNGSSQDTDVKNIRVFGSYNHYRPF